MAEVMNALAFSTASSAEYPLANSTAMAADIVHPVPWVWGVAMRSPASS